MWGEAHALSWWVTIKGGRALSVFVQVAPDPEIKTQGLFWGVLLGNTSVTRGQGGIREEDMTTPLPSDRKGTIVPWGTMQCIGLPRREPGYFYPSADTDWGLLPGLWAGETEAARGRLSGGGQSGWAPPPPLSPIHSALQPVSTSGHMSQALCYELGKQDSLQQM